MSALFVCETCGSQFKRWNSSKFIWKTCSMKCRNALYRKRAIPLLFNCQWCKKEFRVHQRPGPRRPHRCCSRKCSVAARTGIRNPNRKGSRFVTKQGYIFLRLPNDRLIFEHRLLMEQILGRTLLENEVVHHINNNKSDNRPENLALMTNSQHGIHHKFRGWAMKFQRCISCGKTERPHAGLGLCSRCSRNARYRNKGY